MVTIPRVNTPFSLLHSVRYILFNSHFPFLCNLSQSKFNALNKSCYIMSTASSFSSQEISFILSPHTSKHFVRLGIGYFSFYTLVLCILFFSFQIWKTDENFKILIELKTSYQSPISIFKLLFFFFPSIMIWQINR